MPPTDTVCRVLFGTDHPFFPPLDTEEREWLSVTSNMKAVLAATGDDDEQTGLNILGGNAMRILHIDG